jgi:hypothetical protein
MQTFHTISKESAKQALLNSGYLIESRVESVLWKQGYLVNPNPVYEDPYSKKHRELDLLATDSLPIGDDTSDYGNLSVTLLIECINNKHPLAFIEAPSEKRQDYFNNWGSMPDLARISAHPNQTELREFTNKNKEKELFGREVISYFSKLPSCHHYKGPVTTQYCSFHNKNEKTLSILRNGWLGMTKSITIYFQNLIL